MAGRQRCHYTTTSLPQIPRTSQLTDPEPLSWGGWWLGPLSLKQGLTPWGGQSGDLQSALSSEMVKTQKQYCFSGNPRPETQDLCPRDLGERHVGVVGSHGLGHIESDQNPATDAAPSMGASLAQTAARTAPAHILVHPLQDPPQAVRAPGSRGRAASPRQGASTLEDPQPLTVPSCGTCRQLSHRWHVWTGNRCLDAWTKHTDAGGGGRERSGLEGSRDPAIGDCSQPQPRGKTPVRLQASGSNMHQMWACCADTYQRTHNRPVLRDVQNETVPWPSGRGTDTGPPTGPRHLGQNREAYPAYDCPPPELWAAF
ncbi:unnamed protein product [Gulo gulo]|uniref:Uncharacterized protein n=1 Tax=Gulo gulo TaxID=48420 RepID=A0A9X9MDH8_GULGU|nr:unnamed protein product [Gulo gulo]